MSTTVDTAFIQLYASEVKAAYQRQGALLRNVVRQRTGNAERIYFPKLGKGIATTKARHADVVPMDLEHTRAYVDMLDFYAPEYIDELDQVKVNWSMRADYAMASAWALGRQTDNLILNAMNTGGAYNNLQPNVLDTGAAHALTLKVVTGISQAMTDNDVPADGMRIAVINPLSLNQLLQIAGATSSDFTREQLLNTGKEPAFWMGFRWVVHTGVPAGVKGFFYHMPSVGLGLAADIKTEVNYVPTKASWLVNSMMSMGATVIDSDGVFRLEQTV